MCPDWDMTSFPLTPSKCIMDTQWDEIQQKDRREGKRISE
jgi:hypothetical protein